MSHGGLGRSEASHCTGKFPRQSKHLSADASGFCSEH